MNNESIVARISDSRIDPLEMKVCCEQCGILMYEDTAIYNSYEDIYYCNESCLSDWLLDNVDEILDLYCRRYID